jgi:beta-lactamase class D
MTFGRWTTALVIALAAEVSGRAQPATASCFILYEVGVGEIRRGPSESCAVRVTPASTFKIPHAVAALDAGVVADIDTVFKFDGSDVGYESWRRDHTLASAMHFSVVWYFQRIATRLGMDREREYLRRFDYGNRDPSSGLTPPFWIGGSLQISPEEELRFLQKLYADQLPASPRARGLVRAILEQPRGTMINALGPRPFNAPWSDDVVLSAKSGSATDRSGSDVRWFVGQLKRGSRAWLFVSNVVGPNLGPYAAVDQAELALRLLMK